MIWLLKYWKYGLAALAVILIVSATAWTIHIYNENESLKTKQSEQAAEISRLNLYMVELSKDKAALEKGKSSALSKVKSHTNNSVPVPAVLSDTVIGLQPPTDQ